MTPEGAAYQEKPKLWQSMLEGALAGLAGSAGAKHFGAGVGMGAAGAIKERQRQFVNQQEAQRNAAQIRFQDAESAVNAAKLQQMDKELSLRTQEQQDNHAKVVADLRQLWMNYGVPVQDLLNDPGTVQNHLENGTAQAQAAGQQGASVPTGVQLTDKQIHVPDFSNTPVHPLYQLYTEQSRALGSPIMSEQMFLQAGPKGRQTVMGRLSNQLAGEDNNGGPLSGDKVTTAMTTMKANLDAYRKKFDANPQIVALMQNTYDKLKAAHDQRLSDQKDVAKSASAARGQGLLASRVVPITDENGKQTYTTGDKLNGQATAASGTDLDKNYLKPAQDTERSYQMFQQAYSDYRKGASTGAQSMLALSQHLGTTFGGIKGNRITKDMIMEHLHARSVSDDALVAVQRLTNGDVLSPNQWEAFRGLITQSRNLSWGIARQEAGRRGIKIDNVLPRDLGGKGDITQSAEPIAVQAPNGKTYHFKDQASADHFKQLAGIK